MGGYATSLSDCELCCVHYFVVVFLFDYVYHFFFAGHFLIDSIVVSQTFRLKKTSLFTDTVERLSLLC